MLIVYVTIQMQSALVDEDLAVVREMVERAVKERVAGLHPGYAADSLRCLAMYHWPHPELADVEFVAGAYLYSLIRAPQAA